MSRFAGIKNNHIQIISDTKMHSDDYSVIEIPNSLNNISDTDIILKYKYNNKFYTKYSNKSAKDLKIALVSNYGTKCGIATYSKFLYDEIIKLIGDYKLFIEKNDIYEIENPNIPDDKIMPCWKRGEGLSELVFKLKEYDPDIIWINHEYGLFPDAKHWLSFISQLSDYRIITTLHSVFHHKDKTICEAVIPEIIVHLDGAKDVLKNEKKISGNVYVIPHGCYPLDNNRLWNFYKSEHTIIQMGFLFRYKGWQEALKTINLLKPKYKDIFFTGICSESPFATIEHQIYYNELIELINQLDIKDNVSLIRGFQSENVLDSYFKTNRVALFPYVSHPEHEVFGASGAARLAMSKGLPVISSNVNHFIDLPTIKAVSPEQMAQEIDKIFSDNQLYQEQLDKQNKYIIENSWTQVAIKHIKIFENPPTT